MLLRSVEAERIRFAVGRVVVVDRRIHVAVDRRMCVAVDGGMLRSDKQHTVEG